MARPSWRVASACEIGTSHLVSGVPCQDYAAQAFLKTRDGTVFVAVVCDGAGSATHSAVGSWLASTTFIELVEVHFESGGRLVEINRKAILEWITHITSRLADRAVADGSALNDYACTLLASIVGSQAAVFAQIGDGAIVVSHGEVDGWSWVFWPQHGEYANQTSFLTSAGVTDKLEFNLAERRIDELALFSDGIERMVLHGATKAVNDAFFNQMFVPVRASRTRGLDLKLSEQLRGYLGSSTINARTNDDKTLVMATRRSRRKTKP